MSFLNLAAFGFAALIPIVILLYFLKLKRKERIISSTFLWQKAIADLQANQPFQKLRRNLLLLLQLLIISALIFSLARPYLHSKLIHGKFMVVILDASASMKSTDVGKSRFEEAKKYAMGFVDGLMQGDSMLVITSASKNQVATGFSGDKSQLRRVIQSLQPTDTIANIKDAIILASSLLSERKGGTIILLSDGAFGTLNDITLAESGMHFVKIGQSNNNAAITALDIRPVNEKQGSYQAFVSIRNYKKVPITTTLSFYMNKSLADAREISIPAEGKISQVFDKIDVGGGVITAKLDIPDDLPVDNEASSVLKESLQAKVLLVSKGNYFLERALSLNPSLEVSMVNPANYAKQPGFDVIIFDNTAPANLPPGNYLFLNAIPTDLSIKVLGDIHDPTIIDWNRAHEITRFVNFGTVQIASAQKVQLPASARILLESKETPLIYTLEEKGKRMVFCGFDLYDSNLPLRVGFPIFVSNTLDWLKTQSATQGFGQVRTGTILPIYHSADEKEITVTNPAGQVTKLDIRQNPVYFDGIDKVGVYQIKIGKNIHRFTANLQSEEESNLEPKNMVLVGSKSVQGQSNSLITNKEIGWWFALVALLVVIGEWWVYHRKITA